MSKHREVYSLNTWTTIFRRASANLVAQDPFLLAGATAFFTIFALPPIIIIIIQAFGLVLKPSIIRQEIYSKLGTIFGADTRQQIINTLEAVKNLAENNWVIVFGSLFLLFVATNLFKVLKVSLNKLWSVRPKQKLGLKTTMLSRLRAVLLIIAAGFLLVLGLVGQSIQVILGEKVSEFIPFLSFYFKGALHYLFSILINTAWFALVFRYLADVRPSWNTIIPGAIVTSILYNIGKLVLHALLLNSNIDTLYGASASIVLLLLFVFYVSLILYFGASFIIAWANYFKQEVRLLPYMQFYKLVDKDLFDMGTTKKQP